VGRSPTILVEYRNFIKKLRFPVETLPINIVGSGLVTECFGLVIFAVLVILMRGGLPLTVVWLPALIVPQLLFTAGICWFLSALGLFLRDLGQVIGYVVTLWFFLTPICYSEKALKENVLGPILVEESDLHAGPRLSQRPARRTLAGQACAAIFWCLAIRGILAGTRVVLQTAKMVCGRDLMRYLALLLLPAILYAVDCKHQGNTVDQAICTRPELRALDQQIEKESAALKAKLTGENAAILSDSEMPFLRQRNDCSNQLDDIPGCVQRILTGRHDLLTRTQQDPNAIRDAIAQSNFIDIVSMEVLAATHRPQGCGVGMPDAGR
jgi:hypothetical protein